MLLKVFQRLGVYNPDVRLPAEVSCTTIPIEQSSHTLFIPSLWASLLLGISVVNLAPYPLLV